MSSWRSASLWSLAVAESRRAIRWQVWQGQSWLITRANRTYAVRFIAGRVLLRRWRENIVEL
jgi:hypothetical protein